MKKTPWFDGSVNPVRVGPYESLYNAGEVEESIWLDWWDGKQWRFGKDQGPCFTQSRPWRGLTKPPKGTE